MMQAKPKMGVVSLGHEGTHGGRSLHHGAILDGYPMRYGIVAHPAPATSKPASRRQYYGGAGKPPKSA